MNILRICLLAGFGTASAWAEDAPLTATQAAERVILPKVEFRENSLADVAEYFAAVTRRTAKAAPGQNIIVAIPNKPRPTITLQREGATVLALLKEAGAQAGCEVQGEQHALVIREKGAPPLPPIVAGQGVDLRAIRKKLDTIVFPRLEFRDSTTREAIEFIVQKTKQLDPDGAGVSMLLKLDDQGAPPAPPPAADDIPGIPGLPRAGAAPIQPPEVRISFQASNIPLLELLRYVAGLADLQVTVERFGIVITRPARRR